MVDSDNQIEFHPQLHVSFAPSFLPVKFKIYCQKADIECAMFHVCNVRRRDHDSSFQSRAGASSKREVIPVELIYFWRGRWLGKQPVLQKCDVTRC